MTFNGVVTDAVSFITTFGTYLAIGVAVPLGIKLVFVARKLVTKR